MYIKKKLIAISAVLAIAASFAACSDNGSSGSSGGRSANKNGIVPEDGTLSEEELNEVIKHDLTIKPFVPGVQQDAIESDENTAVDNPGGNAADVNSNSSAGGNAADANGNSSAGGNAADANSNSSAGGNANNNNNNDNNSVGNSQPDNNPAGNDIGNNNVDIPKDTGLKVINGTPVMMQAYWMDMSKKEDYVYNGEYLLAQFKIKDNVADGIYPIRLALLDFANWDSETVNFTGIDGAVVVGGEAEENKFNDDDTPQVMVSNVSGKPGEIVTVAFHIKNNPGVVANILRFSYNSDALEYVGGGEGADFDGSFA